MGPGEVLFIWTRLLLYCCYYGSFVVGWLWIGTEILGMNLILFLFIVFCITDGVFMVRHSTICPDYASISLPTWLRFLKDVRLTNLACTFKLVLYTYICIYVSSYGITYIPHFLHLFILYMYSLALYTTTYPSALYLYIS